MNIKKILALLLVLCMAVSVFTACGGGSGAGTSTSTPNTAGESGSGANAGGETAGGETAEGETGAEDTGEPEPLTLPLSEEKAELSVWAVYSGAVMTDLNEIEGVKKMEELTNVHINWVPVGVNEAAEKLGILLAASEYPDIVYPASEAYPGGIEKGIEDGVVYEDHDSLIRKYMPNYMNYLNNSEEARREATSDSGKMSCIKVIVGGDGTAESEGTYQGLAYRKDILESLGLEEPTTVAGWHDALVKAKESGMDYPLMLDTNGGSALALSWGVSTLSRDYLQLDGDKVVAGVLLDGYGEYLDTMREWYSEGLIDPNFTSFNYYLDTPASVENNEKLMYSLILSAFTGNNYAQMHMVNNPDEFLQPIAAPALNEGDKPVQSAERIIAKDTIFISTSCKDPVLAAKWLDFLYSEEGELLSWYGIEGDTYEMVDGEPQFTEKVLTNPEGPSAILERYCLDWGNCWLGKHNAVASEKISTAAAGGVNQQMEAVNIWSAPETNVSMPVRSLTPTDEEGTATNSKLTAITTLIQEHTINYIIGEDDTSFEDFKAQLLQYGYQDVIDTYQDIYDRYLAR